MSVLKIKFYSDPGHGWAAVKRQKLHELCIADQISSYSYQKGNTVYLEEDCDLDVFCTAIKNRGGKVELVEKITNSRSPIRSYESYRI